VAATTNTRLAADLGEPDNLLGARAGKTVTFTVTDSASITRTVTATTDINGHAETSQALPSNVYGVSAAFTEDTHYKGCATATDTLVTVQAAGAKATGGGWIAIGTGRTHFGFNVIPEAGGLFKGQFQLRSNNGKVGFHGNAVSRFSGSGTTASWSGTGVWNGSPGYSYTINVLDGGPAGSKKADAIAITIKSPSNTTVYSSATQSLQGGNITLHN
jgi:hypothetical protein